MKHRVLTLAISAMTFALLAAPALARPLPPGGITRQEAADWLSGKGYPASVHPDSNGLSIITSKISGVTFDIYFFGCERDRCKGIQYAVGWSGVSASSIAKVNNWNTEYRYLRSYSRNDDVIFAEYDVDVSPGGTWELLDKSLERFGEMVPTFKTYMDF